MAAATKAYAGVILATVRPKLDLFCNEYYIFTQGIHRPRERHTLSFDTLLIVASGRRCHAFARFGGVKQHELLRKSGIFSQKLDLFACFFLAYFYSNHYKNKTKRWGSQFVSKKTIPARRVEAMLVPFLWFIL